MKIKNFSLIIQNLSHSLKTWVPLQKRRLATILFNRDTLANTRAERNLRNNRPARNKRATRTAFFCLAAILTAATLTSCEYINIDIKSAVTEALDKAVVERVDVYGDINNNGIHCIASDYPYGFRMQVRNPRNTRLGAHYYLNNGSISTEVNYASQDEYESVPDSQKPDVSIYPVDSYGWMEVSFSKSFLKSREMGIRDISGNIVLFDMTTQRPFDPYPVSLRVNTRPISLFTTMLQRAPGGGSYVLCFYFPKLCQLNEVHFDTHTLYINDDAYYFTAPTFDGKFYTDSSCQTECTDFTTTRPAGLLPLKDNSELFPEEPYTDYVPVYFYTGDAITTDTLTYTIRIEDDEGLSSFSTTVSNNERVLTPPTVTVPSEPYYTDETGCFTLIVSHDGKCLDGTSAEWVEIRYSYTVLDEDGNPTTDGPYLAGSAYPGYPAEIRLWKATYSEIKIYARRDGFMPSDPVVLNDITIRQAPNFYVSESGYNGWSGLASEPLRTIQAAINKFVTECPDDSTCNIYLLSDITADSGDFNSGVTSLVTVSSGLTGKTINIIGWNKDSAASVNRTINAQRTSSSNGRVFSIQGGVVNLRNLTITGGYSGEDGGGLFLEGSGSDVSLTNCTVTGNTASMNGGGIAVSGDNIKLQMNGCTVNGNHSGYEGGGLYVGNTGDNASVTISNSTISGNTTNSDKGGGLHLWQGTVSLSGCTISGNASSQKGGAVSIGGNGVLKLDGTTSIPAGSSSSSENNGIYMLSGASLGIESSFAYTGSNATVELESYVQGSAVLTGYTNGVKIASSKFKIANSNYKILEDGTLSVNPDLYVSSSSSTPAGNDTTGDGSEAKPFATVKKALEKINDLNVSADYIIHVTGWTNVQDGLTIKSDSFNENQPTSIKFIGTTNITNDKLVHAANGATTITIDSSFTKPVYFENLTIKSGKAPSGNGGGICVGEYANVTLVNCNVTDNYALRGGGVYVASGGTLKIKGKVTVTGNKNGNTADATADNIYLCDGAVINIDGVLDPESRIGVKTETTPTADGPIVFTSGLGNSGLSSNQKSAVFVSDANPAFAVVPSGNELALAVSTGNMGGNATDYSITLSGPSYVSKGATLTVNATIMNGNTVVTPQSSDSWLWDIHLKDINGTPVGLGDGRTVFINGTVNSASCGLPVEQGAQIYEGETYRLDVTVTYTPDGWSQGIAGSAQFVLQVPVEYSFHETVTTLSGADANGSGGSSATYVYFGDWPQTIKAANVNVDESQTLTRGGFTYYKGDDGNWYAKQLENAYATGYSYSDGTPVAQSSANSYKYFKVEPIKWRVLTIDYDHDGNSGTAGKKLLLAENILINGTYYDDRSARTINGSTVYPNNYEHSRVRAYLNGLSYNKSGSTNSDYRGKGFLQTAFTNEMQSRIVTTTVDNSAESTNPDGSPQMWNSGANQYASDTPTSDKVFLLSEKEVTTTSYGFGYYSAYDSARLRKPTDFALSSGVFTNQFTSTNDGGIWWLRSPSYDKSYYALRVYNDGKASTNLSGYVDGTISGVLPALCLDN